jgi:hypothetical protein
VQLWATTGKKKKKKKKKKITRADGRGLTTLVVGWWGTGCCSTPRAGGVGQGQGLVLGVSLALQETLNGEALIRCEMVTR